MEYVPDNYDQFLRHERTFYHTCTYCGANLDPGEKCDCRKEDNEDDYLQNSKEPYYSSRQRGIS